ncbi:MAG: T9SS type A sorting domain-containing protein [Bacteroidia bacterium]|nr:T9SS type A sorting domain-containing protein [Bacteroidia bacterium]
MRIYLSAILLALSTQLAAQCGNWLVQPVATMPARIANNAVCEGRAGNSLYAFSYGGIDTSLIWSGITRRAFRYNVAANSWDTIAPLPDTLGKIASSASCIGDTVYIIGGYHVFANGNEISSNKVHRYVISANAYIADGAPVPVAIDDQVQAVFADSLIYVITGWSNTANVNNVQIYNVRTNTWAAGTPVPNAGNYRVFGASGVIQGHTIYYYGGAGNGTNFPATTFIRKGIIDAQNPTQITWSIADTVTATPGYRTAAAGFRYAPQVNFSPVWMGGSNVSYNFNALAYNGSGTVQPAGKILQLDAAAPGWTVCTGTGLPMDQRGLAELGPYQSYDYAVLLCGGIDSNRRVTDAAYLVTYMFTPLQETTAQEFALFPNPAQETVTIAFAQPTAGNVQITITDMQGRISMQQRQQAAPRMSVPVGELARGVYVMRVETEQGTGVQRLVINR